MSLAHVVFLGPKLPKSSRVLSLLRLRRSSPRRVRHRIARLLPRCFLACRHPRWHSGSVFEGYKTGDGMPTVMSLTHTQQVQRLYRSALRTAFDWAYHRYSIIPSICFSHFFVTAPFSEKFSWQRHHAYAAFSRLQGYLSAQLCLPSPCAISLRISIRHAPDGQALLKAGTVHLAQCVLPISLCPVFLPSDTLCRYQHADPYHSRTTPPSPVLALMAFAVPYVEGSSKWQRNTPPPASVRPHSLACFGSLQYLRPHAYSFIALSDLRS